MLRTLEMDMCQILKETKENEIFEQSQDALMSKAQEVAVKPHL